MIPLKADKDASVDKYFNDEGWSPDPSSRDYDASQASHVDNKLLTKSTGTDGESSKTQSNNDPTPHTLGHSYLEVTYQAVHHFI